MELISREGLTLNQWVVRQAAVCQLEANKLWDDLDRLQSREDFNRMVSEYNEVCDYMDELEINPEQLFSSY